MGNTKYWILIIITAIVAAGIFLTAAWSADVDNSIVYAGTILSFIGIILAAIADNKQK